MQYLSTFKHTIPDESRDHILTTASFGYDNDILEHAFSIAINNKLSTDLKSNRITDIDFRDNSIINGTSRGLTLEECREKIELAKNDWFIAFRQFSQCFNLHYIGNKYNPNWKSSHICTGNCPFYIYKDILFICKFSGNYHVCTPITCDELDDSDDSCCRLTGNRYPLVHASLISDTLYREYKENTSRAKLKGEKLTVDESNRLGKIQMDIERYLKIQKNNEYEDYLDADIATSNDDDDDDDDETEEFSKSAPVAIAPPTISIKHEFASTMPLPIAVVKKYKPRKRKLLVKDINTQKLTKRQQTEFNKLVETTQRRKEIIIDPAKLWCNALSIIKWLLPELDDTKTSLYAHDCVRYYQVVRRCEQYKSHKNSYTFLNHVICCFLEMIGGYKAGDRIIIPASQYVAAHLKPRRELKYYKDIKINMSNLTKTSWMLRSCLGCSPMN